MKKKFRKLLSEKCKDMGLTGKALDDLVEIGGAEGLDDDASDEDIAAKVDSLMPYAKAMQGRSRGRHAVRNRNQRKRNPTTRATMRAEMTTRPPNGSNLSNRNCRLSNPRTPHSKRKRQKTTRQAEIAAKAKKLRNPRLPDEASIIRG